MVVGPTTINKAAGKLVYSNFNSFSKNVRSSIRLRRATRRSNVNKDESQDPFAGGKHVLRCTDLYDDKTIDEIRSKLDNIIQDGDNLDTRGHDGEVYQRGIGNYTDVKFDFERFPEVENLITDQVIRLLESYYGSHFEVDYLKLYRNYHIPPEIHESTGVYSDRWHTDSYQPDATKLFVNLSDVTENHGPLHIISRDETKRLVNMRFNRRRDGVPGQMVESKADVMKATGSAGTAMIANSNICLHRADNPVEGNHRDLAMLVFNPSDEPYSDNWTSQLSRGKNLA